MGFIVKVFLALAVVAGGAWAYMTFALPKPAPIVEAPVEQPAPEPVKPQLPPEDGGISTSGSTDEALNADLQILDAQVGAAETASTDAENSLNDKPVAQTE
jgi:hypothetical protein